jgi:hypothetical protein
MANTRACCPIHGELLDSTIDLRSLHRHDFITPDYKSCPEQIQLTAIPNNIFITTKLLELYPYLLASHQAMSNGQCFTINLLY